ncbi:hypothetical protein EVAR_38279_1 [Eumeta japonica]|uniref:Uncharacterized protein n=1 Tax=Eumeta variegata TaxID=151549 RepID=A0A4C1W731_EUMVA|nr:hypothetical protein EVAR_38279_1 [Eumeta japonica]
MDRIKAGLRSSRMKEIDVESRAGSSIENATNVDIDRVPHKAGVFEHCRCNWRLVSFAGNKKKYLSSVAKDLVASTRRPRTARRCPGRFGNTDDLPSAWLSSPSSFVFDS